MREILHVDSIVIVTSRSKDLLHNYCDEVHEVNLLPRDLAKQLFAVMAFGLKEPSDGMRERADAVVASCGGLPLALEVSMERRCRGYNDAMLPVINMLGHQHLGCL